MRGKLLYASAMEDGELSIVTGEGYREEALENTVYFSIHSFDYTFSGCADVGNNQESVAKLINLIRSTYAQAVLTHRNSNKITVH